MRSDRRTPHVPDGPTGSPHEVAHLEGGVHEGGVVGDGEGGGSGEEEKKEGELNEINVG